MGFILASYLVSFHCLVCIVQGLEVLHTFRDPEDNHFQKIAVDEDTGQVYIGATNRLHQLTSNLSLVQSAVVGPREDNPNCPHPIVPCSEAKVPTASITKGLVINYEDQSIILCTNLFHGFCQILKLNNITVTNSVANKPLVPNTAEGSCVMLIAPGADKSNSLYIGAEYTSLGIEKYRDLVPSISSRELKSLEFVHRDTEGGTRISMINGNRKDFTLKFVYAFASSGYVYFIVNQKKDLKSSEWVTRISRLCQGDKYFRSYVEIPLECSSDPAASSGIAQAATLMDGNSLVLSFASVGSSTGPSWVCHYFLQDINKAFDDTVKSCYAGQGKVGPAHYQSIRSCMSSSNPVDYCGSSDFSKAHPSLEGRTPLLEKPIISLPNDRITSLTSTQEAEQNMLHAGTQEGYIIRMLVDKTSATVVKRLHLGMSQPILEILNAYHPEKIYALTSSKVYLLSTDHCKSHSTCAECVDGVDPLCGWCVMEARCSVKKMCQPSAFKPYWLSAEQNTCLNVSDVYPSVISYQTLGKSDQTLKFSLESVLLTPSSDLNLGCLYQSGEMKHSMPASITNDRLISCPLPGMDKLTPIAQGEDHEKLNVHFHVKGKSIVTRSVSLFNCNAHSSCTNCTLSKFGCKWCYTSGQCVESKSACKYPNGTTAKSVNSEDNCPQIIPTNSDRGILVHSGLRKQIAILVRNILPEQNTNLKCSFTHSGQTTIVDASITSSSLSCSNVQFSFEGESPYTIADFMVTWGPKNLPLDNPNGLQVRIYKCMHMVTYCGQCLSMDPEYECGWCEGSCNDPTKCEGKCLLQRNCTNSWLDRAATCPNPQITRFTPATGPIKGSTLLTVTGINLGKVYSDITADVAGKPCTIKSDHYHAATRFLCEVGQVDVETKGIITVTISGQYTVKSDAEFVFVDPLLLSLSPQAGPKSGGTVLTLTGDHLDAGSETSVKMEGGMCEILKINRTAIECKSPAQPSQNTEVRLEVIFSGYRKSLNTPFHYKPDPTVKLIEPLKTIVSGGTTMTIRGEGFDLIQRPQFFTAYQGKNYTEDCKVTNVNIMECQVPAIHAPDVTILDTSPLEVQYGFIMASVEQLKNVSSTIGPLRYYPDPIVHPFSEDERTKKFQEQDLLSIQGSFHVVNVLIASVHVFVGQAQCTQVSASDKSITCLPPSSTPEGTDSSGKAQVTVHIGNIKSAPGFLRYYSPAETSKPIALGIILGVVLPILFIVILLTICVLRRHRKHKPDQNYIPDVLKDYEGKKSNEEEMTNMDNLPIKVDMNGGQMDRNSDSSPYINELLAKFEEPVLKQSISAALISRSKLDIGDLIGKGYYGVVYKAVYKHTDSDKQADVAAKTLLACRSEAEALQQFLQDVAMVRDLSHPHLLRVVGAVVSASDDPIVVMPFMATEDLGSYVREPAKSLSLTDLLVYCNQIADAMAYLEHLRIVHRNLAARNCIITEEDGKPASIKLTDYVVTASLFPQQFYIAEDGTVSELVRWMAPESITDFTFTSKSDVWSFGIVMWEVLTRGVEPYPNTKPKDVVQQIQSGKRLPKPKSCPEVIYEFILSFWTSEAQSRPTFGNVMELLAPFVNDGKQESHPMIKSVEVGGAEEYKELFG
nr:plexin-A2-like isoform X2 [Biomphalaria glabrata]